jgi:hypothetical protein
MRAALVGGPLLALAAINIDETTRIATMMAAFFATLIFFSGAVIHQQRRHWQRRRAPGASAGHVSRLAQLATPIYRARLGLHPGRSMGSCTDRHG